LIYAVFLLYLTARAGLPARDSLKAILPPQIMGAALLSPVLLAKVYDLSPVGLLLLVAGVGLAYFGCQLPRFRPSWLNRWGATS
jgi:hypothetical protein